MIKRKTIRKFRKAHRYLGLFLGIQFLMWTISGMYFSWTDIDEIHGDHFRKQEIIPRTFENLISPTGIIGPGAVSSLVLRDIGGTPYYYVNGAKLVNAQTGEFKNAISEAEALAVAKDNMLQNLEVIKVDRIDNVDLHHEYRGGPLPAYVISYDTPENVKAYVSMEEGTFRKIRHRDWRWFDFLWMTHTMDYEGRDNFNTTILRIFSVMGLITVLSGFTLWFLTSPTMRRKKGSQVK